MSNQQPWGRLSRSRSVRENAQRDDDEDPTLPTGDESGKPPLTSRIPLPHNLTTPEGEARSNHFMKNLINKERQFYEVAELNLAPPVSTYLDARKFFLKFVESETISGKAIYVAQFVFEKFYAQWDAPSHEGIETLRKCSLAIAVKMNEFQLRRTDSLTSRPYEILYKDGTHKETDMLRDMELKIVEVMGYKIEPPTPFDYLPRLVLDYFSEVSEYETKYDEISSLLLKLMAQEDFDTPINRSKPSAMALAATAMIAAGRAFPEFNDHPVLKVKKDDFIRYVTMMQAI